MPSSQKQQDTFAASNSAPTAPAVPTFPSSAATPPGRGLYGRVHIPISALNAIIIIGSALIVVLIVYASLTSKGYAIRFDSRGGSDVEMQYHHYGETIREPAAPLREGYRFLNWSSQAEYNEPFDFSRPVGGNVTLYACWEKIVP